MKPREPRRKTLVRARMNAGEAWHDACILNISSSGLGMQAASPPPRGAYLEIRRGLHVIVGRVMWSREHRFGIRAQDRLPVDLLADNPEAALPQGACPRPVERRSARRVRLSAHERSRNAGRRIEYAFAAVLALCIASFVATEVHSVLAAPADMVTAALGGHG